MQSSPTRTRLMLLVPGDALYLCVGRAGYSEDEDVQAHQRCNPTGVAQHDRNDQH